MLGVRQSPEKVKRANKAYSFDDAYCLVMVLCPIGQSVERLVKWG